MDKLLDKINQTGIDFLRVLNPTQDITNLTRDQISLILSFQSCIEKKGEEWYSRHTPKSRFKGSDVEKSIVSKLQIGKIRKRFLSLS